MNWFKKLVPAVVDLAARQLNQTRLIHHTSVRLAPLTETPTPRTSSITIGSSKVLKQLSASRSLRPISFTPRSPLPDSLASGPQIKKRPTKKKQSLDADKGYFSVIAYATAEEYDLDRLRASIVKEDLYEFKHLPVAVNEAGDIATTDETDFLYVSAKIQFGDEPREIFFFREGSVVLWNCSELESSNVLSHLRHFEVDSYDQRLVQEESDVMAYNYVPDRAKLANGNFYLSQLDDQQALERYTFANALSTSVKLGIWEAALDRYVESMEYVTEDLKRGRKIKMSRAEVLRKTGELFALRHLINLSSDLLDTPDFYWDREQLETLYSSSCGFFSVQRRTKVFICNSIKYIKKQLYSYANQVMNEKLNHCVELADLVASNLNDIHHVRLEWMIIILIMFEVAFETIHLIDRFM